MTEQYPKEDQDAIGEYVVSEGIEDASLLNALHEAARNLSYYNAADSTEMRMMEEKERDHAWYNWRTLKQIAIERGVFKYEDFKGYLI